MLRIIVRSYRNNLHRYAFAIITLALATFVCSLGLSGVRLMAHMWRYPFTMSIGGHILVRLPASQIIGPGRLISYEKIYELVQDIYPEATITSALMVPAVVWYPEDSRFILHGTGLQGRRGGFDIWYLNAPVTKGEAVNTSNLGEAVFTLCGKHLEEGPSSILIPARVSTMEIIDGEESWGLVGVDEKQLLLIGTTSYPVNHGLWGHLEVVQQLANVPSDRVTLIGICLQGLQAEVDDRVELLRKRVDEQMLELQVFTVDDFAEFMAEDLVPLRNAAKKYTPVLLLISLQVVIATALAIVHSRRRELSILRIIGFSYRKIWLLFTLECLFSAALACALGLIGSKITAYFLFGSSAVSLLPFVFAFLASLLVSLIVGRRAVSKSIPSVLRNA